MKKIITTIEAINQLNKLTGLEFYDNTDRNDICNALRDDDKDLKISLPNSSINSLTDDLYNGFNLVCCDPDVEYTDGLFFDTIEELAKHINEMAEVE